MNNSPINDITIIGAGPAGITAALFAHTKNLQVQIVEGLEAGGQLRNLYPNKPVYNFPGFSIINGGELATSMITQVREKDISLLEYEAVIAIEPEQDRLFTVTTEKRTIRSRVIVFSAGMGLLQPRLLDVPGENDLAEQGIYYAVKNINDWTGKDVVVFGGGNSAVDNALLLQEQGCRVILIHKLNKFQAEEASVEQLTKSGCGIRTGCSVLKFETCQPDKIKIFIQQAEEGSQQQLTADRALINIGLKPNLDFMNSLDLAKKGKQLLVDTEMQTTIAGIFACGDVVAYPGKVRLIVTAIGEAATAINKAEQYIKAQKKS